MWNVVAWVLQALLAVAFLFHGIMYAIPPEPLVRSARDRGQWPPPIPPGFRVFIGVAEILAAIGLVLPGLFHLATFFTPLAAAGLVVVMIGAVVFHLRRGETPMAASGAVLLILAAVVVLVRWQVAVLS